MIHEPENTIETDNAASKKVKLGVKLFILEKQLELLTKSDSKLREK